MQLLAEDIAADKYRTNIVGDDKEDICLFFINFTALEQFGTVLASHGKAKEKAGEQDEGSVVADGK